MLEHPEIGWIEKTGYPSWMQEDEDELEEESEEDFEEDPYSDGYADWLYDQKRDRELFGEDY